MPILIDLSKIIVNESLVICNQNSGHVEIKALRQRVLKTVREIKQHQSKHYGDLVLCLNSHSSWRRDIFPYYTATRRPRKKVADWSEVISGENRLRDEFTEYLPYRVIEVDKCEASDVIGALAGSFTSPVLLISSDMGLFQAHYQNTEQWDLVGMRFFSEAHSQLELNKHIILGAPDHSVPNFLSPDDAIASKRKQAAITNKDLALWVNENPKKFCDEETYPYYKRNEKLLDLSKMPSKLTESIFDRYRFFPLADRSKLFEYFTKVGSRELMGNINGF
jgi:hypothetical protein